jgi:hypothetical protein
MRFSSEAELRQNLQRHHGVKLPDDEWRWVVRSAGIQTNAALDEGDWQAASDALRQTGTFGDRVRREVHAAREAIGITSGVSAHAGSLFAVRLLEQIETGVAADPAWREARDELHADLGRLLLLCAAARRIAVRINIPMDECLFALLADSDGTPFQPPESSQPSRAFLREFVDNAVTAICGSKRTSCTTKRRSNSVFETLRTPPNRFDSGSLPAVSGFSPWWTRDGRRSKLSPDPMVSHPGIASRPVGWIRCQ